MTAGMAKMTMKAVVSCDQQNIGMRFSDIPGARSLKTVVMIETETVNADISVKVIICAQISARFPGEKLGPARGTRSEERRVGKECRSRWTAYDDRRSCKRSAERDRGD